MAFHIHPNPSHPAKLTQSGRFFSVYVYIHRLSSLSSHKEKISRRKHAAIHNGEKLAFHNGAHSGTYCYALRTIGTKVQPTKVFVASFMATLPARTNRTTVDDKLVIYSQTSPRDESHVLTDSRFFFSLFLVPTSHVSTYEMGRNLETIVRITPRSVTLRRGTYRLANYPRRHRQIIRPLRRTYAKKKFIVIYKNT